MSTAPALPPPRPAPPADAPAAARGLDGLALGLFLAMLAVHVCLVSVQWNVAGLLGQEFRQTQTAVSAFWMQKTGFRLDYETPVLGKPWSAPMEFPLYQWLAVEVSRHTGLPLVVAGRWVNAAGFYALLPALWLLLGLAEVPRLRRLLVLVPVLACPVYVFYSRAFLIESLALAGALWHVYFVVECLRGRRLPWMLPLALLSGALAVLVKATTWSVCLLPACVYGVILLWRIRPWAAGGSWSGTAGLLARAALATLPVLLLGLWWVQTADAIKARNPAAHFLLSGELTEFNFGAPALRWSLEFWRTVGTTWIKYLAPEATLATVVLGLGVVRGRWRPAALFAAIGFVGAQLVFANLYFLHDYYFYANAVFLCLVVGLALLQLLESPVFPLWSRVALLLLAPAAQLRAYWNDYYQLQRLDYVGGSGLTQAIAALTDPADVLVIYGDDWASIIPYYSGRRALMVPPWRALDEAGQKRSLELLRGERIPLLLVKGIARDNRRLLERRLGDLEMHRQPLLTWDSRIDVYVREDLLDNFVTNLEHGAFNGVELKIRHQPEIPPALDRSLHPVDPERQRLPLSVFSPIPYQYVAPYGLSLLGYQNTRVVLAHTPSEFHFHLPAGARTLKMAYGMTDDSWARGDTDGVDFEVIHVAPDGARRSLWRVFLDPKFTPADRGRKVLELPLTGVTGGDLIVLTDPGPKGNAAFDWAYIESLQIR